MTNKNNLRKAIQIALSLATPLALADASLPGSAVSYLFVEEAAGGTITGPDDEHLQLTLKGLHNYIVAYTDRPIRKATAIPNQFAFDAWPATFAAAPPNAVLSFKHPSDRTPVTFIFTLSNPRYDEKRKQVTYDAARIFKTPDINTPLGYSAPVVKILPTPKTFGAAVLNVDNAYKDYFPSKTPGGQMITKYNMNYPTACQSHTFCKGYYSGYTNTLHWVPVNH